MGSKNRIAKEILPIILENRQPNQWYVEPFCGGCNTIDKVDSNSKEVTNSMNSTITYKPVEKLFIYGNQR